MSDVLNVCAVINTSDVIKLHILYCGCVCNVITIVIPSVYVCCHEYKWDAVAICIKSLIHVKPLILCVNILTACNVINVCAVTDAYVMST